jgi:rRNA maturation endonuclease Nob1
VSHLPEKRVIEYRFTCLKCQTSVVLRVPFQRKLCPLCGDVMSLVSVNSKRISEEKGGEKP